ncbi:hypothetical protein MUP01_03260 [Candidatus Bathyarchaeota archaeon]|nr:hypothetical protein [Candidatus Bathyarchaeota archaeon]
MKCPKCNNEMMVLCRRDASGFLSELYHRCLSCGCIPEQMDETRPVKTVRERKWATPKLRVGSWRWQAATATMLATIALISVMQIPVPVTVFAAETSIDPVKDILPYINLVNFTISQFSINYTEGQIVLRATADYASVTTTETVYNVTTCVMVLGKVLVNYQDSSRTINMGFSSMTLTLTIKFKELTARIDATAYMPLWTDVINRLTGQTP